MVKPLSCILFSAARVLYCPREIEEKRDDVRSLLCLVNDNQGVVHRVLESTFRANRNLLQSSISVLRRLAESDDCRVLSISEDLFVDPDEAFLAPELMRFAAQQMVGLERLAKKH